MTEAKVREPALAVVLIETTEQRWYLAGFTSNGDVIPLLCSEPNYLSFYLDMCFEMQVTSLRHTCLGILSAADAKLCLRDKKVDQFAVILNGQLDHSKGELTHRLAEHMESWFSCPPAVVLLLHTQEPNQIECVELLAGQIKENYKPNFGTCLDRLLATRAADQDVWKIVPCKNI